jgi:hypothetical protein
MPDRSDFEARLADAFRRYAGRVPTDVDAAALAREIATASAHDSRRRRRWWPFGQAHETTRRTQTMLSPAKAITAAALVFGVGGVLLIAQPFDQQAEFAPGAEGADYVEPVEFRAVIALGPEVQSPTCEVVGGMTQCLGQAWTPTITEVSDSRLEGEMTDTANMHQWPLKPMLAMETYRITNEDGAWQGSFPSVYASFNNTAGAQSVVLVGEGDYEGLYAWMDVTDWSAVNGVIFSYPPPEAPAPVSAD